MTRTAVIVGAGPAGLTAAYELLQRTDIVPIILEKDIQVGGLSKTVEYKGNRMDTGPHRFFSKSDRVMNWWMKIMPLQRATSDTSGTPINISYRNQTRQLDTAEFSSDRSHLANPRKSMLVLPRLTRIYFLRQFFVYPIQLSVATLRQMGVGNTLRVIASYIKARIRPRNPEKTLEDFLVNKFGRVLFELFFKDYTEKVWGVACSAISAEWGAQRIKGVSLSGAILHAAKGMRKKGTDNIRQKTTETSLIEQFLYPAMGAGSMWEEVARRIVDMGGQIITGADVLRFHAAGQVVTHVEAVVSNTLERLTLKADFFFSTMPVRELIEKFDPVPPRDVRDVASGLLYRDFLYVGVLVSRMSVGELKDNWIYIQEKDVKVARIQIYNNWGPYMVADPDTIWLGLEYFCYKGDTLWSLPDEELRELAISELVKMQLVARADVLDTTLQRLEKTYPAYFGTYDRFAVVRNFLDGFENLFLVGRNGMHKYNNADHSMLTAMTAVDNIVNGVTSKSNIWDINTEQIYNE